MQWNGKFVNVVYKSEAIKLPRLLANVVIYAWVVQAQIAITHYNFMHERDVFA